MNQGYRSTIIIYERGRGLASDRVTPYRVTRQWLDDQTFGTSSRRSIFWRDAVDRSAWTAVSWQSYRSEPLTRAKLLADGTITLPGHGQYCLALGACADTLPQDRPKSTRDR